MRFIKDSKGSAVLWSLVTVVLIVLIISIIATIGPMIGYETESAVTIPGDVCAQKSFTFSGNTSDGDFINITDGSTTECFEFETTGGLTVATCYMVDVTNNQNSTTGSATAFASSVNTNSSLVTASVSSATVTLTAETCGASSNNINVTDTSSGITTYANLTGGSDGSQWNSSVNTNLPTGVDIWEVGVKFTKIGVIIGIVVAAVFAPLMGFMIVRRYR
jgi:hypothetical protein